MAQSCEEPIITKDSYRTASLNDWARDFWNIYQINDREPDLLQLWVEAVKDGTSVGEAIREGRLDDTLTGLAHTFCWIMCFVSKIQEDLQVNDRYKGQDLKTIEDMVWHKYPRMCASCLLPRCQCPSLLPIRGKPSFDQAEEQLATARKGARPKTLDEWGDMFETIYKEAHFIKSLADLGFHYLEEMGEVLQVIRSLAKWKDDEEGKRAMQVALADEIADTVSWTYSIIRKVASEAKRFEDLVEDFAPWDASQVEPVEAAFKPSNVLWKIYGSGEGQLVCPIDTCRSHPCRCPAAYWVMKG